MSMQGESSHSTPHCTHLLDACFSFRAALRKCLAWGLRRPRSAHKLPQVMRVRIFPGAGSPCKIGRMSSNAGSPCLPPASTPACTSKRHLCQGCQPVLQPILVNNDLLGHILAAMCSSEERQATIGPLTTLRPPSGTQLVS